MTTTYIDDSALPALPPPIPLFVAPAPRPLGFWRALAWFALATIAAFTVPFAYGIALAIANVLRPGRPLPLPQGHDPQSYVLFIAMVAAFFAILLLACRRVGVADYLALRRPRGPFVRLGALAFVVPLAGSLAAAFAGGPGSPIASPTSVRDLAVVLFAVTVIAPVGEELIFRGYLFRALADSRAGVIAAIVITALVWASLHTDKTWLGMAATFFSGLVWGWLRWRTQSTLTTIAVHGLNNLVAGTGFVMMALGAG